MANTPELRDHLLDIPQMTSRPHRGLHDWVRQTPWSFKIIILKSIIKHKIQAEFYASLKHEAKECVFAAQEAHTSSKSHHELNIWQIISPLKSERAPAKTYPASRKASLNQDKSTYTSGEQVQLIELSSFSICSTVQT
jgi:hypothetical protein